jgi:hypothetical protein
MSGCRHRGKKTTRVHRADCVRSLFSSERADNDAQVLQTVYEVMRRQPRTFPQWQRPMRTLLDRPCDRHRRVSAALLRILASGLLGNQTSVRSPSRIAAWGGVRRRWLEDARDWSECLPSSSAQLRASDAERVRRTIAAEWAA